MLYLKSYIILFTDTASIRLTVKSFIKTGINEFRELDLQPVVVMLSVAILQTISWYYTSRGFFAQNLAGYFDDYQSARYAQFIYWFAGDFISLFLLPVLIIRFILRGKLSEFGFRAGDYRTGIKFTGVSLLVMGIIIWFVSANSQFLKVYPHLEFARESLIIFLLYELGILLYMFSWEFMWRGFTLFGLYPKFGLYAVFIQMIPFVILHNGKPALETFSSVLGGIVLGYMSLKLGSFIYAVIIHFGVMFFIDMFSALRYTKTELGTGFEALYNIIFK